MRVLLYSGALLLAALFAIVLGWAIEHYRARPQVTQSVGDPRLSFRPAAHLARGAVRKYHALPTAERQELRDELLASMSSVDEWARDHVADTSVLCIGERHEESIRTFVATAILPRLHYQILMLETSRAQLHTMLVEFDKHQPVKLLAAPLNAILNATRTSQPAAQVIAIDEHQAATRGPRTLPGRESALVARIREEWQPGHQYTVLFGALHCRREPGWMLHQLAAEDPRIRRAGIMGTVILARYREASAQVLMYLLEEIGLGREVVVVPRVARFPKRIQRWLPLVADAFAGYDSAILFDERVALQ